MRKISSYGKVQYVVSFLIRGNTAFNRTKKNGTAKLLNVGCGPNPRPEFINVDYLWNPNIDICWDIAKKPYPLPSA